MFVSVEQLKHSVGTDETIARFFVDRKVPADNIFWKNKLLYVGRGNGYISIPVYYDILFRMGIPVSLLLAESHIQFMEQVMHFAILVEYKEISFEQQLQEIEQLLSGRIKNRKFFDELTHYLRQPVLKPIGKLGMPVPSLNRADVFLFILCDLPLTDHQIELAVEYWYGLHTSYLLMDDIHDYGMDKQEREENSVMELGDGDAGFNKALAMLKKNINSIRRINPTLSNYFENSLQGLQSLIPKT